MQLVKYDQPRYLAVAFAVNANQSRTVMLWPGINELSDKDWSDVKGHPTVKEFIKLGHLIEVDHRPGNESMLKTMTQDEAVSLVLQTDNVDLIKKWLVEETRPLVLRTLGQKINEMVLPDRRDAKYATDDTTTTEESKELDEAFPRADKLGPDKVARKMAGKRSRR